MLLPPAAALAAMVGWSNEWAEGISPLLGELSVLLFPMAVGLRGFDGAPGARSVKCESRRAGPKRVLAADRPVVLPLAVVVVGSCEGLPFEIVIPSTAPSTTAAPPPAEAERVGVVFAC